MNALKKAGFPVTQQTGYDENIDVGVPVPSGKRNDGQQCNARANPFAFTISLIITTIATFFRFLVMPCGPTVFEDANRQFFRHGGVRRRVLSSLLLLVCGMIGTAWSGSVACKGISSSSWPTIPGVIGRSEITTQKDRSTSGHKVTAYIAKVTYTYVVQNRKYMADRVCFGDYGSSDGDRARQIRTRYPVGSTVLVYYNPNSPEVAVLETGSTWFMNLWVAFGSLITICGIVGLVRAINAQRIYGRAEPTDAASASRGP